MYGFTTGDYLLRRTKDRTLLITSKRRMLELKGEVAHTPYLGGLPIGDYPFTDYPLENLSMDVGPAHQPRSPLAFPSGG